MDDLDQDVDNIIAQITNQSTSIKKAKKARPNIEKDDLEKFIIDNAASVVSDSMEIVDDIKEVVGAGAEPRMIEATAELVRAVTGAIDSLSKLKLNDDKLKSQKEIKQMDIDSKANDGNPSGGNGGGVFLSREEVIKHLFENRDESEVIEEPVTVDV